MNLCVKFILCTETINVNLSLYLSAFSTIKDASLRTCALYGMFLVGRKNRWKCTYVIVYPATDTNDDEHNVILSLWMTNQWTSENLFFQTFLHVLEKSFGLKGKCISFKFL